MSITFIESPPFVVNFREYDTKKIDENLNLLRKTQALAIAIIIHIGAFFKALAQSVHLTIRHSGTSFQRHVLGYYNFNDVRIMAPPMDISMAAIYCIDWMVGMVMCVITTTHRLYKKQFETKSYEDLRGYASNEFNLEHIEAREVVLDASGVPASVQVSDLAIFFDEINFTDPNAPGYIPDSTLVENQTNFTPEQLKEHLGTFIKNVNDREPRLGTPPSYNIALVNAFYKQIEDAVRLSIHKIIQDIEAFREVNGNNVENYSREQKSQYEILLATRARLAIDLAISGPRCGGRYMSEAMTAYSYIIDKGLNLNGTLEECLFDYLGQKREEIALNHIQIHLGNGAHDPGKYMTYLGKRLGIPNSKNYIETLDTKIDTEALLHAFFQEYTVDFVIDAIQNAIKAPKKEIEDLENEIETALNAIKPLHKAINAAEDEIKTKESEDKILGLQNEIKALQEQIKPHQNKIKTAQDKIATSQALREKIIDWFRDQAADWNADEFAVSPDTIENVQQIIANKNPAESAAVMNIKHFMELITYLRNERVELPSLENGWDDFLIDLFALDEAKAWRTETFPGLAGVNLMRKTTEIRTSCSKDSLGTELQAKLQQMVERQVQMDPDLFQSEFTEINKIALIRQSIRINKNIISRILNGEAELTTVITDYLDKQRHDLFLDELHLEDIAENGLSPQMMEWLLVSQKILLPQIQ